MTLGELCRLAQEHPDQAESLAFRWQIPLAVLWGRVAPDKQHFKPKMRVDIAPRASKTKPVPRKAKTAPPKGRGPGRPKAGTPPAPATYAQEVAAAILGAKRAIADGADPRAAARTHGVPPRLWDRLSDKR